MLDSSNQRSLTRALCPTGGRSHWLLPSRTTVRGPPTLRADWSGGGESDAEFHRLISGRSRYKGGTETCEKTKILMFRGFAEPHMVFRCRIYDLHYTHNESKAIR
ncbi:hypothetical protein ATANTOWER_006972 [Ataeniobius toweri]|uniref:Uncharacterized protein n=1 Tax=Ataeniobius toweri TaxID=208326 RepID=A0ABU7C576_9TELE|nr:hypothetical protein [Ataeniobius toweri]